MSHCCPHSLIPYCLEIWVWFAVAFSDTPILARCSFLGESMDQEGTLIFAYYADGASEPKFLYPKYALQEIKA